MSKYIECKVPRQWDFVRSFDCFFPRFRQAFQTILWNFNAPLVAFWPALGYTTLAGAILPR